MAYESFKDASGTTKYRKSTGAGTTGDPSALHNIIDSGTVTTVSTVTTLSQFGGQAINLGNGTVGTGTLRVTLASDSTGTVAATQSGTWNITNISGTISLPTGAATAAKQDTIIGHVDGIETVLGTIDTDTGNIATSAASIDGKITACNTGAVVLAAGTAAIGKVSIDQTTPGTTNLVQVGGSLPAGTNNIGDVDALTLCGQTITFGAGAVSSACPRVTLASDDPAVAALASVLAALGGSEAYKFAPISAASSGDNTIIAAVASKRIKVVNVVLVSSGTVSVRFEDGAGGTALTGVMPLTAQVGFAPGEARGGHFIGSTNTLLNLELSGAVGVYGWIVYQEIT